MEQVFLSLNALKEEDFTRNSTVPAFSLSIWSGLTYMDDKKIGD